MKSYLYNEILDELVLNSLKSSATGCLFHFKLRNKLLEPIWNPSLINLVTPGLVQQKLFTQFDVGLLSFQD